MSQHQRQLEETECTSLLLEPTKLPTGWQIVKAAEACERVTDGTHDSPKATSAGFALVTSQHIRDGLVDFKDTYKISEEDYEKANKRSRVDQYDVLFSMIGSIGAIAFVEDIPKFAIKNVGLFKTNKNYDLGIWLYYFFQAENLQNYIKSRISGTSQKYIPLWLLRDLPILLPPLPEQRAITHTLRTIQKAKEARQRELELERERKAALMQYLFTHGTRNEPRKKTEIGEIPESWDVVHFQTVTLSGTQNGIYKNASFYGEGYQIADMKDVFKGEVLELGEMDRLELDAEELLKFQLHEGDLLFARRSFKPEGAGKCQFVPLLVEPVVFSSSLIRVSLNQDIAEPRFYAYFFNSEIGYQLTRQITRILAVSGISGSDLKKLPVPILSKSEQKEITEVLQDCDAQITALEQESAILDELFRAMLEELMTGRLSALPLVEEKARIELSP